jgi:glutamyl endopeptidase
MRPVRIRHLLVAGTAGVALLTAPAGAAGAAPAGSAPAGSAPAAQSTLTMVNGAGRTITIPRPAVAAAGASSYAGSAGNSGTAPGAKAAGVKAPGAGSPVSGPKPNSVLGADGRAKEGVPTTYPWRAIVYMTSDQGQCTGFMLSRDVVVTAGHCVYDRTTGGGWADSVRVVPAKDGASEPYGSCTASWLDVWTTYAYISTGTADTDYGLVKLTCDIGNTVGWFGWWYQTAENLVGQQFFVEGYPGDHPAQMWWDGDVVNQQTANRMFYSIDTEHGESGSPVYHLNSVTPGLCGGWCVTGIHTKSPFDSAYNSGTRFNPDVMAFINYWIGQP